MSDYISREAAIDRLNKNLSACNPGTFSEMCYADTIETVKHLPAADVAEVRRVTPIRCGMDEYYGEWVRCPNCDFDLNTSAAKFCGGCGAKMDLGEDSFEV